MKIYEKALIKIFILHYIIKIFKYFIVSGKHTCNFLNF